MCLSPSGKTYISRHVKFDEMKFPFHTNPNFLTPTQSSPSTILLLAHTPSIPVIQSTPTIQCSNRFSALQQVSDILTETITDIPAAPNASVIDSLPCSAPVLVVSDPHITSELSIPENCAPPDTDTATNIHPMITRRKAGISKPKAYLAASTPDLTSIEPKTVKSALTSPQWKVEMKQEFNALLNNNTWTFQPLPPGRKPVGCKWVFRIKRNADGSIN